jgi:hypothetical protein
MRLLLICLMFCSMGCENPFAPVAPKQQPVKVNPPLDLSSKQDKPKEEEPAGSTQAPASAPVEPKAPEPVAPKAPVVRNTVIQYTIESCGWCKYDQKQVFPRWKAKGWTILDPVDETSNAAGVYPRYDIYDADGNKKTHKGSLISYKP